VILPDVNVLVHAFRESAPEHLAYSAWLNRTRQQGAKLLLPDAVLVGFMRVVTHPGIGFPMVTIDRASAFVSELRAGPNAHDIDDVAAVWTQLDRFIADDRGVRGNVVPDAYLAAVAISHRARIATRDRGFARFPGLQLFDPATAA